MKELSNSVCIVGVDESDAIGVLPNTSQLALHLEAISNAVRDAGLQMSDVDGIFTAGQHSPALLGEALGITPRYVDGTSVGGCSFMIMVEHAMLALHHGLCDVAVISHGESGRSGVGVTRGRDASLSGQFETPFGFGGAPTYFGLITTRHMHDYGTTLEQWAQVAVSTRAWAGLNPKAMYRDPLTVEEVLNSRPICYPFNVLNICLVTRRRRRRGADPRRPRQGLRQEARVRARHRRGHRARHGDADEGPAAERGDAHLRQARL